MDFTNTLPQVIEGSNAVAQVNELFAAASPSMAFSRDAAGSSGLVWAYRGGWWGDDLIVGDSETLTPSATTYMVVDRADGSVSFSTSSTNWNNTTDYARAYLITTGAASVTDYKDRRGGPGGAVSGSGGGGGGGGSSTQCLPIACSDETTALTTGTAKVTFHMPYAMTVTEIFAGLTSVQATGSTFTVDVNEAGSSILSTKITIDNTEETSLTAATQPVVSDSSLAKGAKITIDIDQVGDGTAKGLKVYIVGTI